MTRQYKIIMRWCTAIDPVYKQYDYDIKILMLNTLIGSRVGLFVAISQLGHVFRNEWRGLRRWAARIIK